MISVVLPTRNGASFLAQSVESCLAQQGPELELVTVDDGSTDGTPELLTRFAAADRRVTVVTHGVSRGLPAALNTGFAAARGELLTWTSDDNAFRPGALARLAEFLETNPGVDVVYTDCGVIDEAGRALGRRVAQGPERLPRGNVVGACFLYRRRVHEVLGGYDESTFRAEDYDFWLRAWLGGFRMIALHEELYLYRVHSGALSAKPLEGSGPSPTERVLLRLAPRMRKPDRALALLQARDFALRRGDDASARSLLRQALPLDPLAALRRVAKGAFRRAGDAAG